MNCDQAFDLMTDPVRDDSTALHEHLDECPRCQQMYETLSPALGLFPHVSAPSSMTIDEFEERELETASSVEIAERVAVSFSRTASVARPRRRLRTVAVYAAVGVISFSSVLGLLMMFSAPTVPAPFPSAECLWMKRETNDEVQNSEALVRSCMTCHVSLPTRTTDLRRPDPRLSVLADLMN